MSVRLAGYAALFDIADAARDIIRKGAFARTLAQRRGPIPLLHEHRPDQQIGVVEHAGEDGRGLRVIARIDNPAARALSDLIGRRISGLSFGYQARGYRITDAGRILEDIELIEISLVANPLQYRARVHLVQ